jgi:hypothetical protein
LTFSPSLFGCGGGGSAGKGEQQMSDYYSKSRKQIETELREQFEKTLDGQIEAQLRYEHERNTKDVQRPVNDH